MNGFRNEDNYGIGRSSKKFPFQFIVVFSFEGEKSIKYCGYINEEQLETIFDDEIVEPFLDIMESCKSEHEDKHFKTTCIFKDKTKMIVEMYFCDINFHK